MTVTINYFAWLRERTGISTEDVELPEQVSTVAGLIDWLATRGEEFEVFDQHRELIQVAVDQQHQPDHGADLDNAREIALFPPMTGG